VIRVLVVDDQHLLRTGTAMVIGTADDLVVVGEAQDGLQALERVGVLRPDVVVTDVRMPGIDGIETTRRITERFPAVKVLVLTQFDLDEHVFGALAAGASGYLLKESSAAELCTAVRTVAAGDAIVAPRACRRLVETVKPALLTARPQQAPASPFDALSARELDVVRALADGSSNAEVARSLFISEATVKSHVASILRKLGVRDRVHIVIEAFRCGVVRD